MVEVLILMLGLWPLQSFAPGKSTRSNSNRCRLLVLLIFNIPIAFSQDIKNITHHYNQDNQILEAVGRGIHDESQHEGLDKFFEISGSEKNAPTANIANQNRIDDFGLLSPAVSPPVSAGATHPASFFGIPMAEAVLLHSEPQAKASLVQMTSNTAGNQGAYFDYAAPDDYPYACLCEPVDYQAWVTNNSLPVRCKNVKPVNGNVSYCNPLTHQTR